jgi:hypothetical protein
MEAQTITNILTFAMSAATVWLAIETRRMAIASKASIDLEAQAYLAFRGVDLKLASLSNLTGSEPSLGLRTALRLANPGKVLVKYHINSINCTHSLPKSDMSQFTTTGGVIFPGEETLFVLPFAPINQTTNIAPSGEISFSLSFMLEMLRFNEFLQKYDLMLLIKNLLIGSGYF